jgi:hypothetical protein
VCEFGGTLEQTTPSQAKYFSTALTEQKLSNILSNVTNGVYMRTFQPSQCKKCSIEYIPTGPAAKYCVVCSKQAVLEAGRRNAYNQRVKQGRKVGSGKGGNPYFGKEHPGYKTGIGIYRKQRKDSCERCGSTKFLCVHHKDEDRSNNVPSNLETVCKRCHQIEHECWKAFEGVTTIPKGSTAK